MDKDVHVPAALLARQQLDRGLEPEPLRHEEEQAHFNELYLLAPGGYFVVAFDGRIPQANVAGAQLIGVARGAVGAHRFRDFVRRAWRDEFDASFEAAINSRAPRRQRIEMTAPTAAARPAASWSSRSTASWPRSNAARSAFAASSTAPTRHLGDRRARLHHLREPEDGGAAGLRDRGPAGAAAGVLHGRGGQAPLRDPRRAPPACARRSCSNREAARQVQRWQRSIAPDFQVSVNKSPVRFRRDGGQYQGWLDYLRELKLPPQSIVVEISEGATGRAGSWRCTRRSSPWRTSWG